MRVLLIAEQRIVGKPGPSEVQMHNVRHSLYEDDGKYVIDYCDYH